LATRKNNTNTVGSTSANLGFEAKLWAAADALRGSMDAAE
jgi:type I restriction enzyme M protein